MSLGNSSVHQSGEIPEITKLPNGRIRVVRRFVKFTREDVDNVNLGSLLGDFGDLDATGEQVTNQGYSNCRLIEVEVETSTKRSAGSDSSNSVLVQTYETLTDSFVEITDPTIAYGENGLKKITRVFRAISGTASPNIVGTTTFPVVPVTGTTTTYLASSLIDDNTAFTELTEVYLEAGQISKSEVQGPDGLPDTKTVTYVSQITVPTSNGILLSKNIDNTGGYKIYNYRYLEGRTAGSTPVGVLQSYEQIIEVRKAGSVTAAGGSTNSLPYLTSIPPRIGKIKATVSIELTASNTVSVPVAYNLSDVSCSATTVNTRVTPIGIEQGGSLTVSVYNTRQTTAHQPFSNHYGIINTEGSSGSISTPASIIRDNDNIIGETLNEVASSTISISGSTTVPVTIGVYDQSLDPVFIDALGDQFYRKTTYTIG